MRRRIVRLKKKADNVLGSFKKRMMNDWEWSRDILIDGDG